VDVDAGIRKVAVLGATGSIGTSTLDVVARHPERLRATVLAAARAGKRLLLANKESLVLAGELLTNVARDAGARIVPIDSEHNAIFQCLPDEHARNGLQRIFLTASGGPFRGRSRAQLADVTPAQAVAHPKWNMGPKISVDSATLMNKGLEVIEAHHLFGLPGERIGVLVHPQSLVHSLVEFVDGSTLAQLGLPDMRTALAVGFGWPARIASGVPGLDLLAHGRLDFEPPDLDAFPCLRLAFGALAAGGTAPAVLNATNEVAVSAFLQGRVGFLSIPTLVEDTLAALPRQPADSLDTLIAADADARRHATQALSRMPVPA
jgi:1-deoxy-D-xylulose-5-phosphate reductoisomerase